jgi:hypothetical protein
MTAEQGRSSFFGHRRRSEADSAFLAQTRASEILTSCHLLSAFKIN